VAPTIGFATDTTTIHSFQPKEHPVAIRPGLMIGAGIAIAGLGLIGAGAGATFTAQVAGSTSISSGGVGLSLNGETGSALIVGVNSTNVAPHFAPISEDLLLRNIGTLDLATTYLSVTAPGCDGGTGAPLAQALHATLTDVTDGQQVYDGTLCSLAAATAGPGFTSPPAHPGVGGQLPHSSPAGAAILYRLVLQLNDPALGLSTAAQNTSTAVNLVFTGFDS
jgi:hypothetical protein